jgi:hypothetical protein
MEKLNFYILEELLSYLNFDDLSCLDISLSKARSNYSLFSAVVNEHYKTLIVQRNNLLEVLDKEIFINEEDPLNPSFSSCLTNKLYTYKSPIAFFNSVPYKQFPTNLIEFLFAFKWSAIGIKRSTIERLSNEEYKKIRTGYNIKYRENLSTLSQNYFTLISYEAMEKLWQELIESIDFED